MKIGITTHAIDGPITGIGNYVSNLVKELILDRNQYTLIHFHKNENELYNSTNELLIPNFPIIPDAIRSSIYLSLKKDFDIVHETGNIGLLFPSKFKKIITIHSLYTYLYPDTVTFFRRSKMQMAKHSYNNIDCIITVSQSLKNEIMAFLKIPEEKVKVIHHGIDNELFKKIDKQNIVIEKIKENYGLDSRFIFNVSTLQPTKNLPTLIKAYYKLKTRYNSKHKLVIAGGEGWKYSEIYNLVKNLNLEKDVIFTGYIQNKDLIYLYNAADIFVFPSLYEGFGIPILEAMACGCPIITSNAHSLPEVVGDAGIMIDPYNVEILANKMHELLENSGLREEMIKKGFKRINNFNWKNVAKQTLDVYEEVISK